MDFRQYKHIMEFVISHLVTRHANRELFILWQRFGIWVEIVRYGYSQSHENTVISNTVMYWNCYLQNGDKIVTRSTDSASAICLRTFIKKASLYMLVHPALKQSQTTKHICFLRLDRTFFSCQNHPFRHYCNKTKTHTHQHTSFKSTTRLSAFSSSYKKPIFRVIYLLQKLNVYLCLKIKKYWVF